MNRGDDQYLKVDDALITPLGKPPAQKPVEGQVASTTCVALEALQKKGPVEQTGRPGDDLEVRTAYVRKDHYPCLALTGTFAIYGYCYLHPGTKLESLLHGSEPFLLTITKATLYLVADTKSSWSRDLVVIRQKHDQRHVA